MSSNLMCFQQYGAPPHYAQILRDYLNSILPIDGLACEDVYSGQPLDITSLIITSGVILNLEKKGMEVK